ncbi:hypothetical protein AGABI2DRAFT_190210 [Agaricus bisporus var. bisporus H97]|uniref:hypothetical protein n=1 Tax=Agaricus bisporus var. bisporus (strain H97 / ATCC MYA-4626 / FGSC 10389) TaxID=936046 RepID=UPI00029F5575|nr:hypothetical protein AGABI2DRAFT_190210 [Agaricus bisporus var. bisporus H97]EKV49750.1 hypothetical protein AGABI2DRAFT_190210 [Agaricus bisporus var. bisporus H97]
MALSFIGKPISLISHSDVRYRGILAGIDPQASTIQLSNVYSMGTESRRPPHEFIPPVQEPYQYIIFRASEVKDLAVDEPVPQRSVHDDPAVLGASAPGAVPNAAAGFSPYPAPAVATSVPGEPIETPPRQGQPPKPTGSGQSRSQGQTPQPQAATSQQPQQPSRNNSAGASRRGSNSVQTAAASLETVERALGDLRVGSANGGARGGRRGNHTGGGGRQSHQQAAEQIKVPTTDFDFESMNARFNKVALAQQQQQQQQAVAAVTEGGADVEEGTEGEIKDGDGTPATTDNKPESAYNPQKSFFDSLSSSTATPPIGAPGASGRGGRRGGGGGGGGGGGRNRREEERERNVATFGEPGGVGLMGPGAYVGGWGGYGRRGGRPRRGGGPGQSVSTRG